MCGRFTLTSTPEALAERFEITLPDRLAPRFNIAPSQQVLGIRWEAGRRSAAQLRWGLVPPWAPDPSVGSRLINARVETASERRAYRDAWQSRRCVVPADGFYEWQDVGAGKQPHWIGLESGIPFAIAGLWERWHAEDGTWLESCTLLTTDAAASIEQIHGRMPLVMSDARITDWLDPEKEPDPVIEAVLAAPPPFCSHPVATRVNDVRNDDADCAARAARIPVQESLF